MERDVIESNLNSQSVPVVVLRNGFKYYGSKNKIAVLENLNMTVPKGIIYGLLGSSGCGKTTLLNCILGQKLLNSGNIWVLGGRPGTKESKVPGPQIGYMPQISGVQSSFTINETVKYFGRIAGMSFHEIDKKLNELKNILSLPNLQKTIDSLSGGEQRRVSFSLALLHQPELVILDEPTVGLDPLIREKIWQYLYEITSINQITIILTTHYIDETRKANMVGLLRNGRILAEDAPNHLLRRFEVNSLEEVFLQLSQNQNHNQIDQLKYSNNQHNVFNTLSRPVPKKAICMGRHLIPMIWKNMLWLLKNVTLLVVSILLPLSQVVLCDLIVGHDPVNLKLGVANEESQLTDCSKFECNGANLSCHYLNYLKSSSFILVNYNSEQAAINSVLHGVTHASIHFKSNYSSALHNRIYLQTNHKVDLENSLVDVFRDFTVFNIAMFTKSKILFTFKEFIEDYLMLCNTTTRSRSAAIQWNDPIYGNHLPEFSEYTTPGMLLVGVSFFAAWATASTLLLEKVDGITERILVMGVKSFTIILSHAFTEVLLVLLQLIIVIPYVFFVIKLPLHGSIAVVILIILCGVLWGITFGILLFATCPTDFVAGLIMIGVFFPSGMLSGILWPVEGMHKIIQKIATCFPFLSLCDSLRNVLQKGWGVTHPQIYWSFISVALWIGAMITITIIVLKTKK